jgi:hypothetical protein
MVATFFIADQSSHASLPGSNEARKSDESPDKGSPSLREEEATRYHLIDVFGHREE